MVIRVLVDGPMLIKSLWEKVCNKSKIFVVSFCSPTSHRGMRQQQNSLTNADTQMLNLPVFPTVRINLFSLYKLPACGMLLQQHEWTETPCLRPRSLFQSPDDMVSTAVSISCHQLSLQYFVLHLLIVHLGKGSLRLLQNKEKATFRIQCQSIWKPVASRLRLPQLAFHSGCMTMTSVSLILKRESSHSSSEHHTKETVHDGFSLHQNLLLHILFPDIPHALIICLAVLQ